MRPVVGCRRTVIGELPELITDFVQSQTDPLREDDEGDPAQHGAGVAAVAGPGALGAYEPLFFVEPAGADLLPASFARAAGDASRIRWLAYALLGVVPVLLGAAALGVVAALLGLDLPM